MKNQFKNISKQNVATVYSENKNCRLTVYPNTLNTCITVFSGDYLEGSKVLDMTDCEPGNEDNFIQKFCEELFTSYA